jgi:hypothetical protein
MLTSSNFVTSSIFGCPTAIELWYRGSGDAKVGLP